MRRLLFLLPLLLAPAARATTQSANPVEVFANGKRAGVYSQPLVVLNISQVFPVASLPATCTNGAIVWAANGRTPTEAAGAGTGVTAVCKSNIWYSMLSNLAVTQ